MRLGSLDIEMHIWTLWFGSVVFRNIKPICSLSMVRRHHLDCVFLMNILSSPVCFWFYNIFWLVLTDLISLSLFQNGLDWSAIGPWWGSIIAAWHSTTLVCRQSTCYICGKLWSSTCSLSWGPCFLRGRTASASEVVVAQHGWEHSLHCGQLFTTKRADSQVIYTKLLMWEHLLMAYLSG